MSATATATKAAVSRSEWPSNGIPDRFPEAEEFRGHNGDVPEFIRLASLVEDQYILHREWKKLSARQQRYILESLNSRGLTLHTQPDRFAVIDKDMDGEPAGICSIKPFYQFSVQDNRIPSPRVDRLCGDAREYRRGSDAATR